VKQGTNPAVFAAIREEAGKSPACRKTLQLGEGVAPGGRNPAPVAVGKIYTFPATGITTEYAQFVGRAGCPSAKVLNGGRIIIVNTESSPSAAGVAAGAGELETGDLRCKEFRHRAL
jgi:hypothetical protein